VKELAAFASSDAGKTFARIEQHWGRDPAAALEEIDDVLAHNLRAAFLMTLAPDETPDEHEDALGATKAAGQKIRALIDG